MANEKIQNGNSLQPITLTPFELFQFVGRRNPFSVQTNKGAYIPVRREISIDDLNVHMSGKKTYGTYVIREDGLCTFAVIDIDADTEYLKDYPDFINQMEELSKRIISMFPEFKRIREFSGRRGYHIWIITPQPENPAFIRELIKSRLRKAGLMNIEVYPKQDTIDKTQKKLGNLVKIPLGKHMKGGWSTILEVKESEK